MITVYNLNKDLCLKFDTNYPLDAMNKLIYYLSIKHKVENPINKTISGLYLYLEDRDDFWCVPNVIANDENTPFIGIRK